MDKEEAARLLAKELGDKVGRQVIAEELYKEKLTSKASHFYQVGDPFLVNMWGGFDEELQKSGISTKKILDKALLENEPFAYANYFFLKDNPNPKHLFLKDNYTMKKPFTAITAYALIGEEEKQNLKKIFYKNVQPDTVLAMDLLGIENFIEVYRYYTNSNLPIMETKTLSEFLHNASKEDYDPDGEIKRDKLGIFSSEKMNNLNYLLEKLGIEARLSTTKYRKTDAHRFPYHVHKQNVTEIVDQLKTKHQLMRGLSFFPLKSVNFDDNFLSDFFNFVFSLPYEEQNIEVHKEILKSPPEGVYYLKILSQEYSRGKYFQEYFNCLDKDKQKLVVHYLEPVAERNPINDSFLWSKGFKDISLDHVVLYKENAEDFIEYFRNRTVEEKKVILKCIMDCDFTNEEVANWINEHEAELLREVGFNG